MEDSYSTSSVPAAELQDLDESEEKDLPDDVATVHTLPDEDEMESDTKIYQDADEPNQFEGLSQVSFLMND